MTEIKKYEGKRVLNTKKSNSSNGNQGTSKKGSIENPYTVEEYNNLAELGTWPGGYIEGGDYVGPDTIITPQSGTSDSSDSSSEPDSSIPDSWDDFYDDKEDPYGSANEAYNSMNQTNAGNNSGGFVPGSSGKSSEGMNENTSGITIPQSGKKVDVINNTNFSPYKPSDPRGCFNRCKEMLATVGCKVSGEEIAIMNHNTKGNATTKTNKYSEGLAYIDAQLNNGHPVIVSVDYKDGTSMGAARADQAGDHFVIIVGGNSTDGYHYYDPATSSTEKGTSINNQFTSDGDKLYDSSTCIGKEYIVTGIRKNQ